MTTSAFNTKTVDGLMEMFYEGACRRSKPQTFDRGDSHYEQILLTAKQFAWLKDVDRRESGSHPRGHAYTVCGQIAAGFFQATEQKYGSAIVNIRIN